MINENECLNDKGTEMDPKWYGLWNYLPETILIKIFGYLSPREALNAGLTCKSWLNACYDESLWKHFVCSQFQIDRSIKISPGKHSWMREYKRLTYHIPVVQTEVLNEHSHQVLYVSFAHNGKLFATCSKDVTVLVWDTGYPARVKHYKDMKLYCWIFTQFCQFNESDTLLLVSGALFGFPPTISGEIAVFSLEDDFKLQCRVANQPYEILGTWYNDSYLISGTFHSLTSQYSTSIIYLNRASQETESEHVPVQQLLFRFCNFTGNSIGFLMVANSVFPLNKIKNNDNEEDSNKNKQVLDESIEVNPLYYINTYSVDTSLNTYPEAVADLHKYEQSLLKNFLDTWEENLEYGSFIYYSQECKKTESQLNLDSFDESISEERSNQSDDSKSFAVDSDTSDVDNDGDDSKDVFDSNVEKLLIFTTGFKTKSAHAIGFIRLKPVKFPDRMDPGPSLAERIAERKKKIFKPETEPDWPNAELIQEFFDKVDHLIDLNGHIIGMSLSPDHRYLYVNNRPWPQGCVIKDPLHPPPIAQEIDIHVIDLMTLKEVGTMFRAHKAYTPDSECFFIFLDASENYIASGAEDKHGYIWDRHYGICLAKYPHADVVNSVAVNPKDSEMLITTSDDSTIKIWRSKNRVKQLKIGNLDSLPKGIETRFKKKTRKKH